MNEFDAFRRAVEIYRDGDWSPGQPHRPTLQAGEDHRTIREICSLVVNSRIKLPDESVEDLFGCIQNRYPALATALKRDPSYGTGARNLLKLMDDRIENSRH
jgi:hypothetical protein